MTGIESEVVLPKINRKESNYRPAAPRRRELAYTRLG